MKVLFLNPIGTLGGAEYALLDLIASLRRASPELRMELLALAHGPLLSEATALGVSTDVLSLPESLATLGESGNGRKGSWPWLRNARALGALGLWVPRFASRLREKQADILHSNGLKTHLLAALAKPRGVPLVWHLHDFPSERRLTARILPMIQGRAALGLGVSQAVTDDACKVLPRLRTETLLNGIRTDFFSPGAFPAADLDLLSGLPTAPNGTIRVGLVATYASWKGHRLFLEAASRLGSASARFYIIGGPIYSTAGSQLTETQLRHEISELQLESRCGLVPFQRNVASVLSALDIVVHASTRREPFGRTIAEAMAAGRVVVAAAAGGVLEQVDDGVTGLLFEANNVDSLKGALQKAIAFPELRAWIGHRARSVAEEKLGYLRLGPRVAAIYDELLAAGLTARKAEWSANSLKPGARSRTRMRIGGRRGNGK